MLEILPLYLFIPGCINFFQLGHYGQFGEQDYQQQFSRKFDWMSFNTMLASSHLSNRLAIIFDSSYTNKSGKCPPYIGRFWSGCAKMAKRRGLEISNIGREETDFHTSLHVEAMQTPSSQTQEQVKWTLINWHSYTLRTRKKKLQHLNNYAVINTYFSKSTFINAVLEMGFHVISRLRNDAYFRCLTKEQSTNGMGPSNLYDEKIEIDYPLEERFEITRLKGGHGRVLSVIIHSRSLKKNIHLCILKSENRKRSKIYFSPLIQTKVENVLYYYKTRLQVEFCFRASKQFIRLTDCQSRNLNKLHFYSNVSLTNVNITKVKALEKGTVLSIASEKVLCLNLLLRRIISISPIQPYQEIIRRLWEKGIKFAVIAV